MALEKLQGQLGPDPTLLSLGIPAGSQVREGLVEKGHQHDPSAIDRSPDHEWLARTGLSPQVVDPDQERGEVRARQVPIAEIPPVSAPDDAQESFKQYPNHRSLAKVSHSWEADKTDRHSRKPP